MPVRAMESIKSQLFLDFSRFPFPGNVDVNEIASDFSRRDSMNLISKMSGHSLEPEIVHLHF